MTVIFDSSDTSNITNVFVLCLPYLWLNSEKYWKIVQYFDIFWSNIINLIILLSCCTNSQNDITK